VYLFHLVLSHSTTPNIITSCDNMSSEMMEPAGTYGAEDNMQDVSNHYGEAGHVGQGPYFVQNLDPSLSNPLDRDMANIALGGTNGVSPSQGYGGDVSSEVITPSNSKATSRVKKGKKTQAARDEDTDSEVASEEDEEEDEHEYEEDDDEFEPEPAVLKKRRSALRFNTQTPKSRKGASHSSTRTRKVARKSTSSRAKDALPFNRQRRPPKNGIQDSRVIPRSYDECEEADKALIDMRDKEHKTWKEVRAAMQELTGQKTGNSTLPNRYE